MSQYGAWTRANKVAWESDVGGDSPGSISSSPTAESSNEITDDDEPSDSLELSDHCILMQ